MAKKTQGASRTWKDKIIKSNEYVPVYDQERDRILEARYQEDLKNNILLLSKTIHIIDQVGYESKYYKFFKDMKSILEEGRKLTDKQKKVIHNWKI